MKNTQSDRLFENARYIKRVEEYDHAPGRFSGGLQTLEKSSAKLLLEKYSGRAPKEVCLKRDGAPFPQEQCTTARRECQPCGTRHPGLCRHTHRDILDDAKRLAKNIFDAVKSLKQTDGECLIEISPALNAQLATQWWLLRSMGKPRRMYFLECVKCSEAGTEFIDMRQLLVRQTNFGIAAKLITETAETDWNLQALVHRTDRGPLTRTAVNARGANKQQTKQYNEVGRFFL